MPAILVVDNQPVVRKGIGSALQEMLGPVTLAEAGDAGAALHALGDGEFDLIVVEPALPDADGLRLIKELRSRRPRTPLLAYSALAESQNRARIERLGATFLAKTAALDELRLAVARALAGPQHVVGAGSAGKLAVAVARQGPDPPHARLSNRELEVLRLLAHGRSAPQAGRLLNISAKTVNTHRQHIYRKLGVSTPSELTGYAFRNGLVSNRRLSSDALVSTSMDQQALGLPQIKLAPEVSAVG
jgi:two-component system invasion response regulator UvrY